MKFACMKFLMREIWRDQITLQKIFKTLFIYLVDYLSNNFICNTYEKFLLIHFMPLASFNTSWNYKTSVFPMFSEGIERVQWHEWVKSCFWIKVVAKKNETFTWLFWCWDILEKNYAPQPKQLRPLSLIFLNPQPKRVNYIQKCMYWALRGSTEILVKMKLTPMT